MPGAVRGAMSSALYDRIGSDYAQYRRPDPRIAARIAAALGTAQRVLNVGAGTGSYEPVDRSVVAVEPSSQMVRLRPRAAAAAVRATAGRLPFRDRTFDAALAILTMHHWPQWQRGLEEMRRVACQRLVIFTWDPAHHGFWLVQDYFPEILEIERPIFPPLDAIASIVGPIEVQTVPIPGDCTDGFLGAYWRRPAAYLDAGARRAISTFSKLPRAQLGLARLENDLAEGLWQERHRALLTRSDLDIGYRLLIVQLGGGAAARALERC